jgi:hypothetical protein
MKRVAALLLVASAANASAQDYTAPLEPDCPREATLDAHTTPPDAELADLCLTSVRRSTTADADEIAAILGRGDATTNAAAAAVASGMLNPPPPPKPELDSDIQRLRRQLPQGE